MRCQAGTALPPNQEIATIAGTGLGHMLQEIATIAAQLIGDAFSVLETLSISRWR